jgi:hypothetical protein
VVVAVFEVAHLTVAPRSVGDGDGNGDDGGDASSPSGSSHGHGAPGARHGGSGKDGKEGGEKKKVLGIKRAIKASGVFSSFFGPKDKSPKSQQAAADKASALSLANALPPIALPSLSTTRGPMAPPSPAKPPRSPASSPSSGGSSSGSSSHGLGAIFEDREALAAMTRGAFPSTEVSVTGRWLV